LSSVNSCECCAILEKECAARQIRTHILTGETKDRQQVTEGLRTIPAAAFPPQPARRRDGPEPDHASNVCYTIPGGTGRGSPGDRTVPTASASCRTVNAFRLIAPGTVEEKIWELQQRKAQTIADVLGERGFATNLTGVRPPIPLRRGLRKRTSQAVPRLLWLK